MSEQTPAPPFLSGGGETGALMRRRDWSSTPLGPPAAWPQALKTLVGVMLGANQPMFVAWFPGNLMLYNDAYAVLLGSKHPAALGRDFLEVWREAAADLAPLVARVVAGDPVHMDDITLMLDRRDGLQEAHFSFSYTPVRGETHGVQGLFCACMETTERVLNERMRRLEREQLGRLFEQAPSFMAMLRGPEHRIERANPGYLRLVGRDVVGRTVADALPEAAAQGYLDVLDTVYRTGAPFSAAGARFAVRPVAGGPVDERHVDFVFQPIKTAEGHVTGIFLEGVDVTERKRAEDALRALNETLEQQVAERTAAWRASEERQRAIFETNYQLQGVITPDGAVLDANAISLAAIGATLAEVVGRPFWETPWFAGTDGGAEIVREGVARVARGETFRREIEAELPIGRRRLDFSMRPIRDAQGRVTAIVPEAADITERRRAEEALRRSQKLEAMGELTGGVAHDFNNLLTPIIGGLDMLQRGGLGGARERRLIDGAMQSADRARILVQRLLAFGRRQPLQTAPVDIAALIDSMAELVAAATGPAIAVTVAVEPGLPAALADLHQLEMAVLNLVVNARDAMPAGGAVRIEAAREAVGAGHRSGLAPADFIRLSVADTGVGMDEATMARAIEPFFSTKGVGKGAGLGLSMAHGLALQLGGALGLSSAPAQGATIDLWLPVSASPAAAGAPPPKSAQLDAAMRRVLLVEDEALVRASTADMLAQLGFEVIEAASAEAAIELLAGRRDFDLLVTDHLMPGLTGVDLARRFRGAIPAAPILIVSGFADVEAIAPDLPRITKPFRQADLAASLATLRVA